MSLEAGCDYTIFQQKKPTIFVKMTDFRAKVRKIQVSLEHLAVLECKEVIKKLKEEVLSKAHRSQTKGNFNAQSRKKSRAIK